MTKCAAMIGLILLLVSPVSKSEAGDLLLTGRMPSGLTETHDPTKEDACDCCQKCKAAKSPVKSEEEEGAAVKNACKDCCNRCGKVLQPTPQDIPPEIVNKPIPQEMIDQHKQ
jgi:hypothetical protein